MAAGATVTDRCTQYALDVVAGVIIAGEYVRLACQRHLDDLEKAKAAPYKYYDIVNIGLHFILKNVRPYAAPCSEA